MSNNKKYWKNLAELNSANNDVFDELENKEFIQEIPVEEFLSDKENLENSSTSRRDFLKFIGFSTAAATLAACEGPVVKSIPYVVQPKEIIPGIANYYATTIGNGYDFANVLIRSREGRPIKVEKNKLAPDSKSANGRVHASILDLYDNARLAQPTKDNMPISWFGFEYETKSSLEDISSRNKEIVLLTQTFASPSTKRLIQDFKLKYNNVNHITYDSFSESAALDAFETRYGIRGLSNYDFSKSKVIVSVGADFLGDWQGGGYDCSYAKGRIPDSGEMSRHIQFESNMTLSGANADLRVPLKLNEQKLVLIEIYKSVVGNKIQLKSDIKLDKKTKNIVDRLINEIKSAGKGSVIISGIKEEGYQSLVLEINEKLKSVKFKGASWDVQFVPTLASITRMKLQSAAHSEETVFTVKAENGDLVFYFGDSNTHAGKFVFQSDVKGSLKHAWTYPVAQVQAILNLDGQATMSLSDQGAMQITVDSGMGTYNYILPAQSK